MFGTFLVSIFFGFPLGLNIGIFIGAIVFKKIYKREAKPFLRICDESADNDDSIEFSSGEDNVSFFKKQLLKDTSPGLTNPDFERFVSANRILQQLWPHLSPAIHKEVIAQSKEPVKKAIEKIPFAKGVRVDKMDLGQRPFRVDSIKSYESDDNLIMMETPIFWGGDMVVRVVIEAEIAGKTVDLPIQISSIQFKALARITLYPLVEQLPCIGGVTLSLLEEPTVDLDLRILDSPDLLSIPPIPIIRRIITNVVAGKMLVYPNEITVPLMPNFGLPDPPKGILRLHIAYGLNIKSSWMDEVDPFVQVELRKGRTVKTQVIQNDPNPTWNETVDIVVDDFHKQKLTVGIYDSDLLAPSLVGVVQLDLSVAQFVREPNAPYRMLVPVYSQKKRGIFKILDRQEMKEAHHAAFVEDKVKLEVSKKPQAKLLIPMLMRRRAARKARKDALSTLKDQDGDDAKSDTDIDIDESETLSVDTTSQSVVSPARGKPDPITGYVCMDVTYIPFATEAKNNGENPAESSSSLLKRRMTFSSDRSRGVLSVHLIKATQLQEGMTTFAEISVVDSNRTRNKTTTTTTPFENNEKNPKYDYKADFVNISQQSKLTVSIYEVPGLHNLLASGLKIFKKLEPKLVGFATVSVSDVSELGSLRDAYTLIGAQTGEIYLNISWLPLELDTM